ncbi:MAG: beta-alanine degradation protein BauB [Actinomycetota bacterium]|jgi:quercetin dioxygenase-like cupin family protein|nr:beta-alanine degradation protein BauB [Actinomycetota bacterium]
MRRDPKGGSVSLDPCVTNPDHYKVVFENERVRVLEYKDKPGDRTAPHTHPDSVMYTRSSFRRRLYAGGSEQRDVEMKEGLAGWLPAQEHSGHNIGDTDTHVIFVELKEATDGPSSELGPTNAGRD